jgi:hypothetical protein
MLEEYLRIEINYPKCTQIMVRGFIPEISHRSSFSSWVARKLNAPSNVALIHSNGNFIPKNLNAVRFVDYGRANYGLRPGSGFRAKDGADPQADFDKRPKFDFEQL